MRLSHLATLLTASLAVTLAGCGPVSTLAPAGSLASVQSAAKAADPLEDIRKAADAIIANTEGQGFDWSSLHVGSQQNGPKYAFVAIAERPDAPNTTFYLTGSFVTSTRQVKTAIIVPVARTIGPNLGRDEAQRDVTAYLAKVAKQPMKTVRLSTQPMGGPKYAFIGMTDFAENGMDCIEIVTGTYAVSQRKAETAIHMTSCHSFTNPKHAR